LLQRVSRMVKGEKISKWRTMGRPGYPCCSPQGSERVQCQLVSCEAAQTGSAVAAVGSGPVTMTDQSLESCRYRATLVSFLLTGWNGRFLSVGGPRLEGSALLELGSLVP